MGNRLESELVSLFGREIVAESEALDLGIVSAEQVRKMKAAAAQVARYQDEPATQRQFIAMLPREVQVLLCRWLADPGAGFVTAVSGSVDLDAPRNEAARTEPDGLVQVAGRLRVLTVEETAAVLKVKPATVRKLLREGHLPGKRIGKGWRILEEELRQWLSTEKEGGRTEEPG